MLANSFVRWLRWRTSSEAQMVYLENGEATHTADLTWWTTEDVATHLKVAPSTIRAYAARGQMLSPEKHVGRRHCGGRKASTRGTQSGLASGARCA